MRKNLFLSSIAVVGVVILIFLAKASINFIIKYPEYVEAIRTLFELISFISSPIILLVAVLGLRQIGVAKDIFKKQSLRESYKIATDECRKFSENIFPLITTMDKFIIKNKITIFNDAKVIKTEKGFKVDGTKLKKPQLVKFSEISETVTNYLNGMELFALPFVNKIADDNIGYLTLGEMFVEEVEKRIAILLPIGNISPNDHKAIWKLYNLWKPRLERTQLMKQQSEIDNQMKKIEYKPPSKSIGTE